MTVYKLYHRTKGRFFHFDEIEAGSDAEAERLAQPLRGDLQSELWQDRRRVAAYPPLGAEGAPSRAARS